MFRKEYKAVNEVVLKDLGTIGYRECLEVQKEIFMPLVESKSLKNQLDERVDNGCADDSALNNKEPLPALILCEHPHVYTLGKHGAVNNMLIGQDFLKQIGAEYYETDRGGDITYHGPGQLVGYPILDIETLGLGLKDYIHGLERTIIDTVAEFGIKGDRCDGAAGVWIQADGKRALRKICAIGVKSSRYVTMHGYALNVNPQMGYFTYINPCGFTDRGVTSMALELGGEVDMAEVKRVYADNFEKVFGVSLIG